MVKGFVVMRLKIDLNNFNENFLNLNEYEFIF